MDGLSEVILRDSLEPARLVEWMNQAVDRVEKLRARVQLLESWGGIVQKVRSLEEGGKRR